MIRKAVLVLAIAALATATTTPAQAKKRSPTLDNAPPPGHTSRRWAHPNGCTYSRVGRPGEVAWIVIVNSRGRGKTCVRKIVQIPFPGDRPVATRASNF